ncbi:MAG: hypothetical protein KDI79_06995 [Anaerolineae bacterium]|nr:hypothetical protein [Anaerolineae bacterium]
MNKMTKFVSKPSGKITLLTGSGLLGLFSLCLVCSVCVLFFNLGGQSSTVTRNDSTSLPKIQRLTETSPNSTIEEEIVSPPSTETSPPNGTDPNVTGSNEQSTPQASHQSRPAPNVTGSNEPSIPQASHQSRTDPNITGSNEPIPMETPLQNRTDTNSNDSNEPIPTDPAAIFEELQLLFERGQSMENLRNSDDNAVIEQCTTQMRESQARVEALQSQAVTLPKQFLSLKVFTGEVWRCVSCSEDASEHCDKAESLMEEVNLLLE